MLVLHNVLAKLLIALCILQSLWFGGGWSRNCSWNRVFVSDLFSDYWATPQLEDSVAKKSDSVFIMKSKPVLSGCLKLYLTVVVYTLDFFLGRIYYVISVIPLCREMAIKKNAWNKVSVDITSLLPPHLSTCFCGGRCLERGTDSWTDMYGKSCADLIRITVWTSSLFSEKQGQRIYLVCVASAAIFFCDSSQSKNC